MTRAAASILGTGGRAITVRLYGQDSDLLQAKAAEVARILEGIDGLVDSAVKTPPKQPSMVLDADLAAAVVAGIRPGDVRHAAATFLEGTEVGGLFQDHEVSDVPVRGTPATWDSVSAVQNLLLNRPDGGQPRLDDVRIPFP